MAQIHRMKNPPSVVRQAFESKFQGDEYTFRFYWYIGSKAQKVYGCEVFKNGKYWHNATQASIEYFELEAQNA